MNRNRWNVERRQDGLLCDRKGSRHPSVQVDAEDNDEEIPGAYAITCRRLEDSQETISLEGDYQSDLIVSNSEDQEDYLEIGGTSEEPARARRHQEADVVVISVVDLEHKEDALCKRHLLIGLIVIFCCFVITTIVTILLLRKGTPEDTETATDVSPDLPFCEYDETSHAPPFECSCLQHLIQTNSGAKEVYSSIIRSESPFYRNLLLDANIGSCYEPVYMAMMWIALEVSEGYMHDIESEAVVSRFVLTLIFASMGGDDWTRSNGWLSRNSACSWYGVVCDGIGNETIITSLILRSNKVNGVLDSRLALLPGLVVLDLYDNVLSGSIPVELWDLAGLEEMTLSRNKLSGSIPTSLSQYASAPTLKKLILSDTAITGSIPDFVGLTSLGQLDLSASFISGPFPSKGLEDLGSIEILFLSNVQGEIPSNFGILSSLRQFQIGKWKGGSIPTSIGKLTFLEHFKIEDSRLNGSLPTILGSLSNLSSLHIMGSDLTGSVPTSFGHLTKLMRLNLQWNRLEGSLPSELGRCSELQELWVDSNFDLTGTIPNEIGNLWKLVDLGIDDTQLEGTLPITLCNQEVRIWVSNIDTSCCTKGKCHAGSTLH